jgi:hypothetical protein
MELFKILGLLIAWQTVGKSADQEIPIHFAENKQWFRYSHDNLTMDPLPGWPTLHGRKAVDQLH